MTEAGLIHILDAPALDGPAPRLSTDEALDVLASARRIAIVGASPTPWRASHTDMAYLLEQGYQCVPVNPNVTSVLGRPSFPTLETAVAGTGGEPFDIVDVFRRPDVTPEVARSAVTTGASVLWLQPLVISWEAAT